jgi:tetratricopeptide (TPR) repeat protein
MRAALALVAALAAVAVADPKPPKRPPPPEPKPEHEEGRSKRSQTVDYDPKTAPRRKVGGKTIVLAEIAISGNMQKPSAVYVMQAPLGPRVEPPRELPPAVLAAVDLVFAADDFGSERSRQLGRYAKGRTLASTATWHAAEAALDKRAGDELRAFLTADVVKARGAASAAIALLDAAAGEDVDETTLAAGGPSPLDAAAETAERVLPYTSGAEQRALAYELLAMHDSPDAALALVCGTASAKPPADLTACKADGLDPRQAAYAWLKLGNQLSGTPLAVEALERSAALATGEQLSAVYRALGDALAEAHRHDEAVRAYAASGKQDRANGHGELGVEADELAGAVATAPNGPADDPDADGLVSAATAIARISAAYRSDPVRAAVLARAALAYREVLDRDGAVAMLTAALEANPQADDAPEWRAQQLALVTRVPPASDAQGVTSSLREAKEPLVRCLRRSGLTQANAHVELRVTANGDVEDATVTGLDGETATCVGTIAKRWQLPAGELRTLVVPVHFDGP